MKKGNGYEWWGYEWIGLRAAYKGMYRAPRRYSVIGISCRWLARRDCEDRQRSTRREAVPKQCQLQGGRAEAGLRREGRTTRETGAMASWWGCGGGCGIVMTPIAPFLPPPTCAASAARSDDSQLATQLATLNSHRPSSAASSLFPSLFLSRVCVSCLSLLRNATAHRRRIRGSLGQPARRLLVRAFPLIFSKWPTTPAAILSRSRWRPVREHSCFCCDHRAASAVRRPSCFDEKGDRGSLHMPPTEGPA